MIIAIISGAQRIMRNTYVHSVVLLELGVLLDLTHCDENGRYATEDSISGAFISLPGIDKMINALLEELSINLDFCHLLKLTRKSVVKRWQMEKQQRLMGGGECEVKKKKRNK